MKLINLKSALKYNSFDVAIGIKILFFRVLVTIEPGRSLLQLEAFLLAYIMSTFSVFQVFS